jgi:uncharacterized membrane protein
VLLGSFAGAMQIILPIVAVVLVVTAVLSLRNQKQLSTAK